MKVHGIDLDNRFLIRNDSLTSTSLYEEEEEEMGAKRDALYMKYVDTGEIEPEVFRAFEEFSLSEVYSEKYLPWMVKEYLAHSGSPEEVIDMARWFNKNYRRFPGVDIYAKTWEQLSELRNEHGMSAREREADRKAKRGMTASIAEYQVMDKHDTRRNEFPSRLPGIDLLVDTDEFKICRIQNFEDAVAYNGVRDEDKFKEGMGESWCIGRGSLAGKEEWREQSRKAVFFYGWWNSPGHVLERACIQVFPGTQIRVWDRNDIPAEIERTPYNRFHSLFETDRPLILGDVQKQILNYPNSRTPSGGLIIHASLNLRHHGLRSFSELGVAIDEVQGSVSCDYNYLRNFRGFPLRIRGDLNVSFNYLDSLEGIPRSIGGELQITNQRSGKSFTRSEIMKLSKVKRYIKV